MASTFRFIHCAHPRFDAPVRSASAVVRARVGVAAREAFTAAVDLALSESVTAFVLVGEVVDAERVAPSTEVYVREQLERLAAEGIALVVLHDAPTPESVAWLPEKGVVRLQPGGEPEAPLRARNGRPIARLLVDGRGDAFRRAPGKPIGVVLPSFGTSRPLVGRGFDESEAGGVQLVSAPPDGELETAFHALAGLRWQTLVLDDMEACSDTDAAREMAVACATASGDPRDGLLRFEMRGPSPLATALADERAAEDLAGAISSAVGALTVHVDGSGLVRSRANSGARTGASSASTGADDELVADARAVIEELAADDALLDRLAPARLLSAGTESGARRASLRALLPALEPQAADLLNREIDT